MRPFGSVITTLYLQGRRTRWYLVNKAKFVHNLFLVYLSVSVWHAGWNKFLTACHTVIHTE